MKCNQCKEEIGGTIYLDFTHSSICADCKVDDMMKSRNLEDVMQRNKEQIIIEKETSGYMAGLWWNDKGTVEGEICDTIKAAIDSLDNTL